MKAKKQRKIENQPDDYLYKENKRKILFFVHSLYRAIPSIVGGLRIGQRKVLFTCLKRDDKRPVKVAQLAGSVGEQTAYHHGEASLMGTIINLAQDFVGSNNINLLQPIGQFGTRLAGGHDSAHARYIFTQLSPITKEIFNAEDDPLLKPLRENGKPIEPENYYPIIAMVLVNGIDGIGTGFQTQIPSYNPADIVKNTRLLINGDEPEPMTPWFKGFKGEIKKEGDKYTTKGIIDKLPSETETVIRYVIHKPQDSNSEIRPLALCGVERPCSSLLQKVLTRLRQVDECVVHFFDPLYYEETQPFHANLRMVTNIYKNQRIKVNHSKNPQRILTNLGLPQLILLANST